MSMASIAFSFSQKLDYIGSDLILNLCQAEFLRRHSCLVIWTHAKELWSVGPMRFEDDFTKLNGSDFCDLGTFGGT